MEAFTSTLVLRILLLNPGFRACLLMQKKFMFQKKFYLLKKTYKKKFPVMEIVDTFFTSIWVV